LRILLPAACLMATCVSTKGPRQGWDERWGELVSHKSFPGDCGLCHMPERWDRLKPDFSFDHAKETGVPLEGAHAQAGCLRCHNDFGPVSAYSERGCGGCHVDPHQASLGGDCDSCHNEQDWRPRGLIADHSARGFPLVGAHAVVACESCHARAPVGEFRGAPRRCEACHRDDAAAAQSIDHAAMGWLDTCERCHNPTTFGAAGFAHHFFPLTGGHGGLSCADCHGAGVPGPIPRDCNSCHSADFQGAPNHVALNYPRACDQCHSTSRWEDATFNHRFPLRGDHDVNCNVCHDTGSTAVFNCLGCHEHSQAAMNDKHREVSNYQYLSTRCLNCHANGEEND